FMASRTRFSSSTLGRVGGPSPSWSDSRARSPAMPASELALPGIDSAGLNRARRRRHELAESSDRRSVDHDAPRCPQTATALVGPAGAVTRTGSTGWRLVNPQKLGRHVMKPWQ